MKTETHGNGHGLNDLYILTESKDEDKKILDYLDNINSDYNFIYSNVKGHEWYGKRFIEIPFGENLLEDIRKII